MKIKLLYLSIFLILSNALWSQADYQPIQCEGVIPSEFITYASSKIELANQHYEGRKKMQVSKRQFKRYNTQSTFYVDYLLKSGQIVFGTPMNDYLNRVGAYVLKSFPGIADEVRFYLVKSPSVNAFTNEQGIVFINIGLIAQLENEAQLAFIISHELIHYKYNHSFESYKEKVKAESNWKGYRRLTNSSKNSMLLQYSRKNESIADSLGFTEGFFHTDYSYDEVLSTFDVLLYSNLPFNEVEFDTTFFDDENYKLSSQCILRDVELISIPEDYDDHNLTHPNIKKRRNMMIDIITSYENPSKNKFIISETEFLQLQKEARFEMTNLYLSNLQYDKAFYNTYLLLRKYPESNFLKKSMAYCVYAIALQKKLGNIRDYISNYKKVQGQSQRLSFLFKKISSKEINALAVKLLWKYHSENPQDQFITDVLDKALKLLIEENDVRYSSIYPPKKNLPTAIDSNKVDTAISFKKLSKEEYQDLSKYDKIRYDKKYRQYYGSYNSRSKTLKTKNYYSVLSTESTDKDFIKLYKYYQNLEEEENKLVDVDRFLIVNPLYFQVKHDNLVIQEVEEHEMVYSNSMKKMANRRNIDMAVLDILDVKENEVNKFNDLALLSSWIDEYEELSLITDSRYTIPWTSNFTKAVRNKYNLRYIATTGLLDLTSYRSVTGRAMNVILGVILWQAMPYFIDNAIRKNRHIYQFFNCIDMETNTTILVDQHEFKAQPSQDFLDAMNYNIMYQLKKKKK